MAKVIDKMIQGCTVMMLALIIYMTLDVFISVKEMQKKQDQDECVPVELIEQMKEQGKELEHYGHI